MKDLLLALVTNANGPFAFVVLAFFGCIGAAIIVSGVKMATSQHHSERMAKIKADHEENMFKTEREMPKIVGGVGKNKAIEHSES